MQTIAVKDCHIFISSKSCERTIRDVVTIGRTAFMTRREVRWELEEQLP